MVSKQAVVTALMVVFAASTARAQFELVPVGAHVRVALGTGASRVEGTLLSNGPDSIAIATSPGVIQRLATASITRLEVRRKSRLAGARRGALIGAPVGCLIVCGQGAELGGAAEMVGAVAMWSAMGAGIGALVRANAWKSIPLTRTAVIAAGAEIAPVVRVSSAAGSLGPPPGTRVRLRLTSPPEKVVGVVTGETPDSLYITTARMKQIRVAHRRAVSIDISQGVDHRAGAVRGVLGTIGVAAGIGAIMCAAQEECGTEWGGKPGPASRFVWGSLLGGAAGVVLSPVGGVIGWNIGVERWTPWR